MAKKVWDEPIDKTIPWDGNDKTDNLPVRGTRVEEFIKDSLNDKMGVFYYDASNNRYLAFADQESLEAYVLDPTNNTNLVLGTFDAPFNYTAEIRLLSPAYNAIFVGSTGNYINFTFDIKNKTGASTGENVNVTYTFTRGATKRVVKETRKYGDVVQFNVDEYLAEGNNIVTIAIVGQSSLAATTVAVTYQVVSLSLSDNLDISKVYDLSKGVQTITIPYNLSGQNVKTLEWYIDGEQVARNENEDVISIYSVENRIKNIPISGLQSGVHTLQFRAYTTVNNERFYTDIIYKEFMVDNGDINDTLIAVQSIIPNSKGLVTEDKPFVLFGIEQYLPYTLRFATSKSTTVDVSLGDETLSSIATTSGSVMEYIVTTSAKGSAVLTLSSRKIDVSIEQTTLNIREITNNLEFYFTARGRNNSATNKDQWSSGDYKATFDGFNWNAQSGWIDNALYINEGASLSFNYAPLAGASTTTGKTIEMEFATRNVDNDDTIICDLRNANGAGFVLMAAEARLTSRIGKSVNTKFKSGERYRIAFVINSPVGVKGLAYIYVNGILCGAVNYDGADNFLSEVNLAFRGSTTAQVDLYSVRVYNEALSSSDILNNYILYRTSIEDMRKVYDRNEILENGAISMDKARHRLPVMLVTGDLPTLDNYQDTDSNITADIDYYNDQDPSKNFRIEKALIRLQGTSSLNYPRKNYRFYTRKSDSTVLYDAEGNVVENRLYAFKDGAQPVDCWCLKADFAESSGTHNTGVARLWNKVMYNANFTHTNSLGETVSNYPLRTEAQKVAKAANYPYDVRTTIDGFPILLFYRADENSDVIFVGKYNFNNDKSTPSVFGFEGIPNFDDSKVQCWEFLDNGTDFALFKTATGWYDIVGYVEGKPVYRWQQSFEARHGEQHLTDLKNFCTWMVGINGKHSDFATQKWQHFDVYKVAAYYVYLMRFGALDQVVKNCFLTSEDGKHFYFINYDNDTILGLDNTGIIAAPPDVTRESTYDNGKSYFYAGHDSALWNMLEADEEFMTIVQIVDEALYQGELQIDTVLKTFNDEQSDKWVERVYNEDGQYKYISPYLEKDVDELSTLQGSRTSHRTWWVSKRFPMYDALYATGGFRAKSIEMKCIGGTPSGRGVTITAGAPMNYGYGLNKAPSEVGIKLDIGDTYTFVITGDLSIGTPVNIFAAPYINTLDFSLYAEYINSLKIDSVYDPILGSQLKRLILGDGVAKNTNPEMIGVNGLGMATRLEELDIRGFEYITSLDLTSQVGFKKLSAFGSGLATVRFAKGALVNRLELPASMLALNLEELPYLTYNNVVFEDKKLVSNITIKNCPNISEIFSFFNEWYVSKTTENKYCSLVVDNIKWVNISASEFVRLLNIKKDGGVLDLKGYVRLSSISKNDVYSIIDILGEGVFDKDSDLYISIPTALYLDSDKSTIYEGEGESIQFSARVIPHKDGVIKYSTTSTTATIDEDSGLFTARETGSSRQVSVKATFTPNDGSSSLANSKSITINKRIYPSSVTIEGKVNIAINEGVYTWTTPTTNVNGHMVVEWSLTGDIASVATIVSQDDKQCVVALNSTISNVVDGAIVVAIKKEVDGSVVASASMEIQALPSDVVMTSKTNKGVQASLYNAGLVANETYSLLSEVEKITEAQLQKGSTETTSIFYANRADIKSFEEFKYFTGITKIPSYLFASLNIDTIELPNTISEIGFASFVFTKISNFYLNQSVKTIGNSVFVSSNIQNVYIQDLVKFLQITLSNYDSSPMCGAKKIYVDGEHVTTLNIPNEITTLKDYAIYAPNSDIHSVFIPSSVTSIDYSAIVLDNATFKSLSGGEGVRTIDRGAFYNSYESKYPNLRIAETIPFAITNHSNGSLLMMGTTQGNVHAMAFMLGQFKVSTLSGAYFDDMTTERTINLNWTGKVEDLTERLKVGYVTLNISSNKPEAEFKVEYTNLDGEDVTTIVQGAGTHYLPIKYNTTIYVSGYTEYILHESKRVVYAGSKGVNTVTCDYTSKAGVFIQHIDGNLYSPSTWSSKGFTNEEANAVALLSEESSFAIAKTDYKLDSASLFEWSPNGVDVLGVQSITDKSQAVLDFDGWKNTQNIVGEIGFTGNYAAFVAALNVFPNGKNGYLGSAGQWNLICNNITEINEALSMVGGATLASYYWTSTEQSDSTAWVCYIIANSMFGIASRDKASTLLIRSFQQDFTFEI